MLWGGCLLHLDIWLYQARLLKKWLFPIWFSWHTSQNKQVLRALLSVEWQPPRHGPWAAWCPCSTGRPHRASDELSLPHWDLYTLGWEQSGVWAGGRPLGGDWLEWMVSCRPWHGYTFGPGKDTLGDQGMPHHAWRAPTGGLLQSRCLTAPHHPPQAGQS